MNLLLWRHAEAEDGTRDLERALTPRGREQAARVAAWLHAHGPKFDRIIVSPARRTRETADALELPYEVIEAVEPGAAPEQVLAAAGWPDAKSSVLVVGHQPTMGRTAALALSGVAQSWTVRKGGVWWLAERERDDESQVVVRAVINPEVI